MPPCRAGRGVSGQRREHVRVGGLPVVPVQGGGRQREQPLVDVVHRPDVDAPFRPRLPGLPVGRRHRPDGREQLGDAARIVLDRAHLRGIAAIHKGIAGDGGTDAEHDNGGERNAHHRCGLTEGAHAPVCSTSNPPSA